MEREPTVILEQRPDSPCPPFSHTQPPRTEVSMETTLSGRAKDYSFVTDGEKGEEGAHKRKKTDSVRHTHTHLHTQPRSDCESSDSCFVVAVRIIQG